MQRFVATPAEYLAAVPASQRPLLDHLRQLIRKTAPAAKEEIKYGMLGYADTSGDLFALAAQKHYVGLYVLPQAVTMLADELAEVDHGKCCLRFKRLEKVPTATIRKLLKLSLTLHKEQAVAKPVAAPAKAKVKTATKKKVTGRTKKN